MFICAGPDTDFASHDLDQPRQDIHVTLPDGSERKGTSWETSPMDIAKELSKSLSERIVISKVRCSFLPVTAMLSFFRWTVNCGIWSVLWRSHASWNSWISSIPTVGCLSQCPFPILNRPLQANGFSGIHLRTSWESPLSDTMVATCALVLLRRMGSSTRWPWKTGEYICRLATRENSSDFRAVMSADYPVLEKLSEMAIKDKQKFERIVVPKETLLEMFGVSLSILHPSDIMLTHCVSTTNTRSTSSRPRYPTARPPRYTAVDP